MQKFTVAKASRGVEPYCLLLSVVISQIPVLLAVSYLSPTAKVPTMQCGMQNMLRKYILNFRYQGHLSRAVLVCAEMQTVTSKNHLSRHSLQKKEHPPPNTYTHGDGCLLSQHSAGKGSIVRPCFKQEEKGRQDDWDVTQRYNASLPFEKQQEAMNSLSLFLSASVFVCLSLSLSLSSSCFQNERLNIKIKTLKVFSGPTNKMDLSSQVPLLALLVKLSPSPQPSHRTACGSKDD